MCAHSGGSASMAVCQASLNAQTKWEGEGIGIFSVHLHLHPVIPLKLIQKSSKLLLHLHS